MNGFFNFIILVDALHLFLTTYKNTLGYDVNDPYLIFKRHIKSKRFILDVLTILSFLQDSSQFFNWLRLFKVMRVFMINDKMNRTQIPIELKKYQSIIMLLFNTVFFLHVIAC